jgi:hypothetical protein
MEKITKREMYQALIHFAETGIMSYPAKDENVDDPDVTNAKLVTSEELKAFAENEIVLLDKKLSKAKENAKKKRATSDKLQEAIQAVLTDEFETIADIAAKVEDEDATVAKCVYRLNALVEAGIAEKTDMKVTGAEGKKRTVKGYKLAGEPVDADEEPTDSVEE